ncbi:MAG: MerR family transcriptional regulator [Bacteroidota bacterium]
MAQKKPTEKLFYSIGEVAGMFDVNQSLIRYWEKEFDVINPHKNKKGNRYFTKKDIDHFHLIYNLVKRKGYTLQGAKDILRKKTRQTEQEFEVVKTLENLKHFLLEIKAQIPPEGEE